MKRFAILAASLLLACSPSADSSRHRSAFAQANGIRIHYLDWGGDGAPLVMIHGIGDSPHVFDDLAPRLSDRFRVIAYARRGHGQSDSPAAGPYDLATMVEDLRQLMDVLGIQKASLLGWSMGGNEITMFAGRHPDRVEKLVYLESGYDWSVPEFLTPFGEQLAENAPVKTQLESLDRYRDWFRAFWFGELPWTPALEAYLRDTVSIGADGGVQPIPSEAAFGPLFASLASPPRDYLAVRAPALVLYSSEFFPAEPDFEREVMLPFRAASQDRISRELSGGATVKHLEGTNHMSIGVRDSEALAATIREFLLAN